MIPQPEMVQEDFRTQEYGLSSSTQLPPSNEGTKAIEIPSTTKKTGGGNGTGGSGQQRCPKCGTFVTFRHGHFEDNTFYCAACSGWFVISPDSLPTRAMVAGNEPPRHTFNRWSSGSGNTHKETHAPIIQPNNVDKQNQTQQEEAVAEVPGGDQTSYTHEVKSMPTPKEIMSGLDEYVIGQKRVKMALSVGVYNHYKRVFIAESKAAMEADSQQRPQQDGAASDSAGEGEGQKLADMNLGQHGVAKAGDEEPTPPPEVNIADQKFGRDVEDCDIDKSNILLLG